MAIKIKPSDKAFADCLKEAFDHTCEVCGRMGRQECSHIHSRSNRTIRWCKDNAKPKCHTCHRWWHQNPTESGLWFLNKYGQGAVDLLLEKKNNKFKVTKLEEKDIAKHYREQLKIILDKRNCGDTGYIDFTSWQ
jgi:hypothetical protein